ncbi:MAG: hypothetical protein ACE5Q3_06915 [Alphaproteobacteria bacterium]
MKRMGANAGAPREDRPSLGGILAEPFQYLSRGGKLRVYASADGRYVLKVPTTPAEIVAWHESDGVRLTELAWARGLGSDDLAIARRILDGGIESYRLAASRLWREAGLVHVHLPPYEDLEARVVVSDETAPVDLSRSPFIVQHRAELLGRRIERLHATGDLEGCRACLDDLVRLIERIWAKGIAEHTLNFHNNTGYAARCLILLDVGELEESRGRVLAHARDEKILHKKSQAWLARRFPGLADDLASRIRLRLNPDAVERLWLAAGRG